MHSILEIKHIFCLKTWKFTKFYLVRILFSVLLACFVLCINTLQYLRDYSLIEFKIEIFGHTEKKELILSALFYFLI